MAPGPPGELPDVSDDGRARSGELRRRPCERGQKEEEEPGQRKTNPSASEERAATRRDETSGSD
jgi:hypothetical protein